MMKLADFLVLKRSHPVSLDDIVANTNWTPESKDGLRQFKKEALDADEILYHDSEHSEWEIGMGSEGWIAVRDGIVIAEFVCRMN